MITEKRQVLLFSLLLCLIPACGGSSGSTRTENNPEEGSNKEEDDSSNTPDNEGAPVVEDSPEVNPDLDIKEFSPETQPYVQGAFRHSYNSEKKILLVDDGKNMTLPACNFPLPVPGQGDGSALVTDGSLGDWPPHSVIGTDQAGDAPGGHDSFDLRYLYWAESSDSYHIAAELQAPWVVSPDPEGYLYLNVYKITMPTDASGTPTPTLHTSLAVISDQLYRLQGDEYKPLSRGTGAGQTDFELGIHDKYIEIRISKQDLSEGLSHFSVEMFTALPDGRSDRVGPFVKGFVNDYACMISLPDPENPSLSRGEKLLIMHRTAEVRQEAAELTYRAAISSLAEAVIATRDTISDWDTGHIISTGPMNVAGLYLPAAGIFVQQNPRLMLHPEGLPVNHLFVAAHEVLHSYNLSDYNLPTDWLREGHSNWFAAQILRNYGGNGLYQKLLHFDRDSFLTEEATHSPPEAASVGTAYWGKTPYSQLYYYRKASLYFGLILTRLDYGELLNQILSKGRTLSPLGGESEFFDLLTSLPSWTGNSAGQIRAGWFGGEYTDSILNKALFSDSDHDGFLAFQEAAAGTSPSGPDSDGDQLSDSFEWATGTNALEPDTYSYLASDNLSGDWLDIIPDSVMDSPELRTPDSPCKNSYNITRYGLARDGDQYLTLVELSEIPVEPTPSSLKVVLIIEAGADQYQLALPFHSLIYSFAKSDGSGLRNEIMFAPFTGKTVEIPFEGSWMGWNTSAPPEGVRFVLTTFFDNTACDVIDNIVPTVLK